jgi:primosomal protein N' (replication factor Y)
MLKAAEKSEQEETPFLIAKVAVETAIYHFDQEFLYEVPINLKEKIRPGSRVLLPFGNGNKKSLALVLEVFYSSDRQELKQILDLVDEIPVLGKEFLELLRFMKEKYYCTFFDALKVIFPSSVDKKKEKLIKIVDISEDARDLKLKLTAKQKKVYDLIAERGELSFKEISYFTGSTAAVIDALIKKRVLDFRYLKREVNLFKFEEKTKNELLLTSDQEKAYKELCNAYISNGNKVFLLYGVTGSGKTSVFIKMIEKVHREGRGVIVMVPEIALTPQMKNIFYTHFGETVAVFHSYLTNSERFDQWRRVKEGKAKIVIGTRSAVFAPFEDIGLIILDEEQESSYKSESTPRYHTREIAKFRCRHHRALFILSSATPSVESFHSASNGKYNLCTLPKRYGNASLPDVSVVDMNFELMEGNGSLFSKQLIDCLKENLRLKKQSILLLNRRGYNTFLMCRSCRAVVKCPNCTISLIYHKANNRLMCHYCGYSKEFDLKCENCNESQVACSGVGTQKVEQELEEFLPGARILRLDADTTMKRSSYEKKLGAFANFEYDILVGTQMVAKGLDFPNVTLVGVVSVDNILYSSDFRSYERTFALLTQVVGRSGRGEKPGRAIIQTFTPENSIIALAAEQNYEKFYQMEIKMRKAMLYPPFASLCVVGFVGSSEQDTISAAVYFFDLLINKAKNEHKDLPLVVLGPSPASILRISSKYRYKIIIKFREGREFRGLMSELKIIFQQNKKSRAVTSFIDESPNAIF